jgi:hypothetical protein
MMTIVRRSISKTCPYKNELDEGELEITFYGDEAPELHDLAARIDELCVTPISHERFTAAVISLVPEAEVSTSWKTGPWLVTVTT